MDLGELLRSLGFQNIKKMSSGGYSCRCQWHDDWKNSFAVYDNGFYVCFDSSCHIGRGWFWDLFNIDRRIFTYRRDSVQGNRILKENILAAYSPLKKYRGLSEFVLKKFNIRYDCIRDKVIIPVYDNDQNLVGIIERNYDHPPNYRMNFPRNVIYGQWRWQTGQQIIVVEGVFDCLRLCDLGFWNTVAAMTSSLTKEQMRLLNRYQEIILMFDTDEAGMNGALLTGYHFLKWFRRTVKCCFRYGKKDPAEFLDRKEVDYTLINATSFPFLERCYEVRLEALLENIGKGKNT
jgi:DNA primase